MEHVPDHAATTSATSSTTIDSLVKVKTTKDNLNNLAVTSCAICTDDFDVDQDVYQLPCSHWFHRDCILPWLGRKNTCPLCRYVLPKEERTNENPLETFERVVVLSRKNYERMEGLMQSLKSLGIVMPQWKMVRPTFIFPRVTNQYELGKPGGALEVFENHGKCYISKQQESEGLEDENRDVIALLCAIFLANQGAGEAAEEGRNSMLDDEDPILQGEKEAEKMIVEAYSALLLAFLSTESKSIRNAIAECLPDHKLAILVPVLERFLEFHLSLNMISKETHKTVLEVIESCRTP